MRYKIFTLLIIHKIMVKRLKKIEKGTTAVTAKTKKVPSKKQKRKILLKKKPKAKKLSHITRHSTSLSPFLSEFNRNIFKDPFFTDPWEELFSFPSFDMAIQRASDLARRAFSSTFTPLHRHEDMDIDTNVPGTYQSKSYYKNISQVGGKTPKGEVVSHENLTHVDQHGKKFTEKKKTYESIGEKVKKTTHTKMIGNRGIKDLKTEYLNTGKEYQHQVFKNMNEKNLQQFNDEFDSSVKNKWRNMIGSSEDFLRGSPRNLSIGSADTDWLGEEKDKWSKEKIVESPRKRTENEGEARRSLRIGEERSSRGKK